MPLIGFTRQTAVFLTKLLNRLIVGESMRPLTDVLSISREKLAFLVDATSAPVASITPISSWIGFEIGLIQTELDKIAKANEGETITISLNGLTAFLESVKFRYCELLLCPN
jgi:Na+/H+ antiporter NhaC